MTQKILGGNHTDISQKVEEKIQKKIEKNTQEPAFLVYLDIEGNTQILDQVPIIIRKGSTLE